MAAAPIRLRQSPLNLRNEIGEGHTESPADRTKLEAIKATLASLVLAHERLALPEFLRQPYGALSYKMSLSERPDTTGVSKGRRAEVSGKTDVF